MYSILVVEDDRELNGALCYALKREGYQTRAAFSVSEAWKLYEEKCPDLVLLDVNLPDGEGYDFCRELKKREKNPGQAGLPVLFLSARDLEEDVLKGYDMGADDYVTKPFSTKILLRKIHTVLKRTGGEERFDDGYLSVDLTNAKVCVDGEPCAVTPTEFRLLKALISHKGQLLTYEVLLERLWDSEGQFVDKHTLAVNVNRLRGKIEDDGHKYISNVYGMGYQWIGAQ